MCPTFISATQIDPFPEVTCVFPTQSMSAQSVKHWSQCMIFQTCPFSTFHLPSCLGTWNFNFTWFSLVFSNQKVMPCFEYLSPGRFLFPSLLGSHPSHLRYSRGTKPLAAAAASFTNVSGLFLSTRASRLRALNISFSKQWDTISKWANKFLLTLEPLKFS